VDINTRLYSAFQIQRDDVLQIILPGLRSLKQEGCFFQSIHAGNLWLNGLKFNACLLFTFERESPRRREQYRP
jgi:hypothetical protein